MALWESLVDITQSINELWMVRGDFNLVTSNEENLGGLPVTVADTVYFNHCISVCNLEDPGFKGSKFTWWNGRVDEACIFERLDKALWNKNLQNLFQEKIIKSFRFLNFWLEDETCLEVIRKNWITEVQGNLFIMFHHKPKKTKKALTQWSKERFGNIFQEIATLEDFIKVLEVQFERNPSRENRTKLFKAQAELNMQLRREEDFWKQKSGFEWLRMGRGTLNFSILLFFEKQFTKGQQCEDFSILEEILELIDSNQNEELISYPTM
ncbi:uncharacterized protein LOC124887126 [Capsicum annuum]|uniref:uncharacterized protein LOC124887126 n=1 Tax=Capsicum annuum TaxID=4072 RepID=UPI001FB0C338|nr:uncharacterized protein LOC124887126 [Capsicum annuum]